MTKESFLGKLENYLRDEQENEKSKSTLKHYKRVLTRFIERLPSDKEITKQDYIEYKQELMNEFSSSTVRNYIVVINKFIKYCEMTESDDDFDFKRMRKYYSKNTLKNIRIQEQYSLNEILEVTDFKRMLRKAKETNQMKIYFIMKIFGKTGIRSYELRYFTVENVKKSNYIKVRNKGKDREIIIPQSLRKELLEYCRRNKIKEGYIFTGKDKTRPIDQSTVFRQLKKLAGQCRGIKKSKVHAHSFRHLFAIEFLDSGGTEDELADVMGHSSKETTRIYTRTTSLMKRRRIESMYKNRR